MRRESQNKAIAKHLKAGKKISPLMALKLYGCYRLAARIFDISNPPFNLVIESKMIYLTPVKFAQYKLLKKTKK